MIKQSKTDTRRGIRLTADQVAQLDWLCQQEGRSKSNMIGRLIEAEYTRQSGPPLEDGSSSPPERA